MEFRSTNDSYSHIKGDLVTNVSSGGVQNSSHGVHLTGGSTGGIVQASGDETNIALTVRGKGAGPLTLGSSGALLFSGGSTAPFSGFLRFEDTAAATPALFNDTDAGRVAETTHAIAAISSQTAGTLPNYYIMAISQNLPAGITIGHAFAGSTTGTVHTRMIKGTTAAIASATCTVEFLVMRMN